MSESFLVCFRPSATQYDYSKIDKLLQQKFASDSTRMLEPGAWLLTSNDLRWSRNIVERITAELSQLTGEGAMMVRSIRDPRDFAVFPRLADEYTEFCNLQALVKKHRLHAE